MSLTYITKGTVRSLFVPGIYRSAIGFNNTLPQNILELQLTEEPSLSAFCGNIIEANGDLILEAAVFPTISFTPSYCALVKNSGAIDLEIIAISPFTQVISPGSSLTTSHKIAIKTNV